MDPLAEASRVLRIWLWSASGEGAASIVRRAECREDYKSKLEVVDELKRTVDEEVQSLFLEFCLEFTRRFHSRAS